VESLVVFSGSAGRPPYSYFGQHPIPWQLLSTACIGLDNICVRLLYSIILVYMCLPEYRRCGVKAVVLFLIALRRQRSPAASRQGFKTFNPSLIYGASSITSIRLSPDCTVYGNLRPTVSYTPRQSVSGAHPDRCQDTHPPHPMMDRLDFWLH